MSLDPQIGTLLGLQVPWRQPSPENPSDIKNRLGTAQGVTASRRATR